MSKGFRIGVDLGGTKIEGAALDCRGAVQCRRRTATPAGNHSGTIEAITSMVAEIEQQIGGKGSVGIGMPGAISAATGLVKNANSTWLNGRPLRQDLEAALRRPVRLAMTPIALPFPKRSMALPPAVELCLASFSVPGLGAGS